MAGQDVPFLAASLLLIGAGLPKLARPEGVVGAMTDVGLPTSAGIGRAVGAVEVTAGITAITYGGRVPAAGIAAIYAAFAAFVALALSRGDLASCGCFGVHDVAPSGWHVAVNSALAASAAVAAATAPPTVSSIADRTASAALVVWLLSVTTAWLIYLLLSRPPDSAAETGRRPRATAA